MELPRSSRVIIGATVTGGLATAALIATRGDRNIHMGAKLWVVAAVVLVMDLYSWVRPLVLFRRSQSQAFHFDEGFFVVLALLTPPVVTVAVFAAIVILAQTVKRRPLIKSAFNFGEVMLSVGIALAVSRAVAVPAPTVSPRAVIGVAIGAVVYFLVSTALVSALVVTMGASWRECISDDMKAQLALSATGAFVGVLLALDIRIDRWATALAVPLLMVLRLLIAAQFKAQHDRARMQGLFNVTLDANRRLSQEAVISSVLEAAREQLRCPTAVLTSNEPGPADMAATIEFGGETQWLTVTGRLREEPFDQADRML
ncbi:MAG TPA: hypothetical protein VFN68_06760, partial [Acidimicrobiales bacterium]|nr:hypothetical protein [Acidimicrobiales bacterium]